MALHSSIICSPTATSLTLPHHPTIPTKLSKNDTAIADTGASDIYLTPKAPKINYNPQAPRVSVGTATGARQTSSGGCELNLSQLPQECRKGQVMPSFAHNLLGIGKLCDAGCKVLFTEVDFTAFDKNNNPILRGWCEQTGAKLWRISLRDEIQLPLSHPTGEETKTTLAAYSAYDLPSVEALVRYFHAAAGFPVKSTWLAAIKAGNYATWPGLTYNNAAKYCPSAVETSKGHLTQTRQGARSTKKSLPTTNGTSVPTIKIEPVDNSPLQPPTNHIHIYEEPLSKLFTDDTGQFPIRSRSGNQYIMVAYHEDSNTILVEAFKNKSDKNRIPAYESIMRRLKAREHKIDLQILDNEISAEYKRVIEEVWKTKYQLVPPEVHRRNKAERAIRTFKDHFIAILAGVASDFPAYMWDHLLEQTEITVNLLRQATLNPTISA